MLWVCYLTGLADVCNLSGRLPVTAILRPAIAPATAITPFDVSVAAAEAPAAAMATVAAVALAAKSEAVVLPDAGVINPATMFVPATPASVSPVDTPPAADTSLAATDDPASVSVADAPVAGVMPAAPSASPVPVSVAAVLTPSAWVMDAALTADPASVPAVDVPSALVTPAAAMALAVMLAAVVVPSAAVDVLAALADPPSVPAVLVPSAWVMVELLPPAATGTQMRSFSNSCHGFDPIAASSDADSAPAIFSPRRIALSVLFDNAGPSMSHMQNVSLLFPLAADVLFLSTPFRYMEIQPPLWVCAKTLNPTGNTSFELSVLMLPFPVSACQ